MSDEEHEQTTSSRIVIPYRGPADDATDLPLVEDARPFVAGCGLTLTVSVFTLFAVPFAAVSGNAAPLGIAGLAWGFLLMAAVGRGMAGQRWGLFKGVVVTLCFVVILVTALLVLTRM